ncbi:MAG: AI-2E family transporter, partial [Acidobacteriota bacterium]|nr:AI-2E family transporter [Acidobacteriota bacterium]
MELSDRQRNIVASAITILSLVVILAALGGLFWLIGIFFRNFSHVFLPLAVAGVVALVFRPYYDFLRNKARLPTPLALAALFLSALIPLAAFGWFFGALIAKQIGELVSAFPAWWEKTRASAEKQWPQVVDFFQNHPLGLRIRSAAIAQQDVLLESLQIVSGKALSAGAGVVRGIGALAAWAVLPVYIVFFLMAKRRPADALEGNLPFLKPETRKDQVFLVHEFVKIIVSFFRGQRVIAFLQGVLYARGF